ncbi:MAG: D-alanyl-D-alanine carboxypeptidase family protein [Candidatus Magasanikbacteria bacterium]|nr:D-alanyl-D-alanine carboxypeptidase family protein [Candidatus Magasanikbacteria bacterium]
MFWRKTILFFLVALIFSQPSSAFADDQGAVSLPGDVSSNSVVNDTLVNGDRCCFGFIKDDPVKCLYSIDEKDSCKNGETLIATGCIEKANNKVYPACSATAKATAPAVVAPAVTDIKDDLKISKPVLSINIPGLNFSDLAKTIVTEDNGKTYLNIPYIGEYISAVYKVGLVVLSIIAVIMIIVVGVKIIVGGGESKVEGFKRIGQILIGLFIGWGSYTILSIVNPDLVNFKALKVEYFEQVALPEPDDSGGDFPATGNPTKLCDTVDTCKPYCSDKSKWDTIAATTGMISEAQTIDLSTVSMSGVKVQKGARASNNLIEPLKKAGLLADQEGYQLYISSGFRSLVGQLAKACPSILEGKKSSSVSWPGGSNHGSGRAVDIYLQNKKGKTLSSPATAATQNNEEYKQYNKKLAEIMYAAGWKRLKIEVWHFEFPGSEVESSRTTSCFETSC